MFFILPLWLMMSTFLEILNRSLKRTAWVIYIRFGHTLYICGAIIKFIIGFTEKPLKLLVYYLSIESH